MRGWLEAPKLHSSQHTGANEMTKTQAMKIARAAKPSHRIWAKESDVRRECDINDVRCPVLDGSDLWTLKALAKAIHFANAL
jgi:hypothetical protein